MPDKNITIHCELTEGATLSVYFDDNGDCELILGRTNIGFDGSSLSLGAKISPVQVKRLQEFLRCKGDLRCL